MKNNNRRKHTRKIPPNIIKIDFWSVEEDKNPSKEVYHAEIINISQGGIKIKTPTSIPTGGLIVFNLFDKNMHGKVKWVSKNIIDDETVYFIGIQFNKDIKNNSSFSEKKITPKKKQNKTKQDRIIYLNKLAMAYRQGNRFEDSIDTYKKALKISSDNDILLYNLAKVYIAMNDNINALETLEKALKINPGFSEAKNLIEEIK